MAGKAERPSQRYKTRVEYANIPSSGLPNYSKKKKKKRNPSTSVELPGGSLLSAGTIVGTFACRLHALNSIRVGNTLPTIAVAGRRVSGGLAFDTATAKRQNIQRAAMGRRLGYRKINIKDCKGVNQ